MGRPRTDYIDIPILEVARRCGVVMDTRTLARDEVEAKCPFCGDKPGRHHLGLNTKRNVFNCNLCGEGGNSVSLYAKLHGISNREAVGALLDEVDNIYPLPQEPKPQAPHEAAPRPLGERHRVFTALLNHLPLSEAHRHNLLERGLSAERIERNQYRTLPRSESTRRQLASLLSDFYDLGGIPGFYRGNRGEWTLAGQPGLLIPYRDMDGLIQGIQIRLDDPGDTKRRYRWLASAGRREGVKSGAWIHVTGNRAAKTAFLTEGGLKGDVASFLDDEALFICIAGVNAIGGLREVIRSLGIDTLVMAADMDKVTNWRVRSAFDNIAKEVSRIPGVSIRAENWNPSHKGIDDYYKVRRRLEAQGKTISMRHSSITNTLHTLWRNEKPMQDADFINACEWEDALVPLSGLESDPPKDYLDPTKINAFATAMQSGVQFPPLVCVNGTVIDGHHRFEALRRLGAGHARVYRNIPWEAETAAAA